MVTVVIALIEHDGAQDHGESRETPRESNS